MPANLLLSRQDRMSVVARNMPWFNTSVDAPEAGFEVGTRAAAMALYAKELVADAGTTDDQDHHIELRPVYY